jgi:hypothetical protein
VRGAETLHGSHLLRHLYLKPGPWWISSGAAHAAAAQPPAHPQLQPCPDATLIPAGTNLVIAGTIQFASAIQQLRQQLAADYPSLVVPKARPLSPGEVLGCTAPVLAQAADAIVFVADGRFHLEAIMIANPSIPAYRYDPYGRQLTIEEYDHQGAGLLLLTVLVVLEAGCRLLLGVFLAQPCSDFIL